MKYHNSTYFVYFLYPDEPEEFDSLYQAVERAHDKAGEYRRFWKRDVPVRIKEVFDPPLFEKNPIIREVL